MTDFDVEITRKFLAEKRRKRQLKLDERFHQAQQDFESIIKMIIVKYRPKTIHQWGSLLDRKGFSEISDIDIAVSGLGSAEAFFSLCHDAETLTNLPLDIVELERIEPEFHGLITEHGRKVYEYSE